MNHYVLVTACVFLALGLLWNTKGMLNIVLKCATFALGVWGLVLRFGVAL